MRTARRVKQLMYYSTYHDGTPIYDTDSEGNIIYDTMPDGELIPRVVGETPEGYDKPVEFMNSITGELTEAELEAFGANSRGMAKMTFRKEEFPFEVGVLIWKNSEVEYKDPERTIVDEKSADYRIVGIQDTGRKFWKALLEAVV